MKIGTQTNSLINNVYSRATIGQPVPVVGMGATLLGWTDRNPATITDVFVKGRYTYIEVQYDHYKVISGSTMDGSAEYEFMPNPKAIPRYFRSKGVDEKWEATYKNVETGRWIKSDSGSIRIGVRDKYYDPSF